MNVKSSVIRVIKCLIILCLTICAFYFWLADPLNFRSPKDQVLLTLFHEHRAAFEKLSQMAIEDSYKKWYFNKPNFENNLSQARKEEYMLLESEIGTSFSIGVGLYASVRFIFASGGLSAISPGWLKGIEYIPGDYEYHGELVQDMDNANRFAPGLYLREIEAKWFIVYQRTVD